MTDSRHLHTWEKNKAAGKKMLAVLLDPDFDNAGLLELMNKDSNARPDLFLVGGSLLTNGKLSDLIRDIKSRFSIPVFLFPGNCFQVSSEADGILFLNLISGRNPEYLIGQQVVAAPLVKRASLEVVPTAYMLFDGGRTTSVEYMSNTKPLPMDKPELAVATALAGEMMGNRLVYLEAGSGSQQSIHQSIIGRIKDQTSMVIFAGGGISTGEQALEKWKAGADFIVVGTALEKNPTFMTELISARDHLNQ